MIGGALPVLSCPVEDLLEISSLSVQSVRTCLCVCVRRPDVHKGGRHHVNAKCNCRSRPALVIECMFVAERAECEGKHFVVKAFYTSLQHKHRDASSSPSSVLTRKNANWIVVASTAAKLDLLLGVCLILETFYGYSKLTC